MKSMAGGTSNAMGTSYFLYKTVFFRIGPRRATPGVLIALSASFDEKSDRDETRLRGDGR